VMALAIAGTQIPGGIEIDTAEAASVTFPDFRDCVERLGGDIEQVL